MQYIHPLRAFRESQAPPLSQEQLAALLDVSRVTITRWESGARKIDDELIPKVVERTGIPAAQLRPDLAALMAPSEPPEEHSEQTTAPAQ